ncbi:CZB domain-containing protein [Thioalkalivibrio sp. ALJ24]|uniref:CZB domain-containing protein n=1 Tax=Thioalkalivibrio sp. ALJ24 TaxID=545276 RepID=UPI00056ECF51|nr:CZB domain-containing protein [Thioalkalivibrio sp. ALJ24]
MEKQDVLDRLHQAKRAHLAWVGRAELLTRGVPVGKDQIPVLHTDCPFGQWYFGDGQVLHDFPEFESIDEAHRHLHEAYAEIFKLVTEEGNASMFSKLLGRARRQHEQNEPVIRRNMESLDEASRTVVHHLDALEHRIRQMEPEEFNQTVRA